MNATYTVTVRKVLELQQTYTLTAGSEREARRRARNRSASAVISGFLRAGRFEHASEANAVTSQTDWRVTNVEIDASAEESGDRS